MIIEVNTVSLYSSLLKKGNENYDIIGHKSSLMSLISTINFIPSPTQVSRSLITKIDNSG